MAQSKFHTTLWLSALCTLFLLQSASAAPKAHVVGKRNGHFGVSDSTGKVLIAYRYDYLERLDARFFLAGLKSTENPQGVFGVLNAAGKPVVPLEFAHIVYDRKHKSFKVTSQIGSTNTQTGYYDENGRVVLPVVYDTLEAISMSGDEPTNIAGSHDKYGYLNIVTGTVLIPLEYEALSIDSLMTDPEGHGIAFARKGGKWGVLSTHGELLVPFEFDALGDFDHTEGATAERAGKLEQLKFTNGRYTGSEEVKPVYSSNFVPRPVGSINLAPFDGLYVAQDYPNMNVAWHAWKEGTLRWFAMPSFQINGDQAYVSFGLFSKASLPFLPNALEVTRHADGFTLLIDVDDSQSKRATATEFLHFTQQGDSWFCAECQRWNLPVHWRWQEARKPQEFGGIGVVIQKHKPAEVGVKVLEVLNGGPAQLAGLKVGDAITQIDGNAVIHLTVDEARHRLRGLAGTTVRLQVIRDGEPLAGEIVVPRKVIKI